MDDKKIKSGPDIVKEFVRGLNDEPTLDKDTVQVIVQLYKEDKLTPTKLQQALELKRSVQPT